MQEEQSPCAISIINAPCHPHWVLDIIPAVARPMCLTEEYAIRALTSVCRTQINLVIAPPIKAILIISGVAELFNIMCLVAIRRRP